MATRTGERIRNQYLINEEAESAERMRQQKVMKGLRQQIWKSANRKLGLSKSLGKNRNHKSRAKIEIASSGVFGTFESSGSFNHGGEASTNSRINGGPHSVHEAEFMGMLRVFGTLAVLSIFKQNMSYLDLISIFKN